MSDSRTWTGEPRKQQLNMVVPEELLARWPAPRVPDGYEMRTFRDSDLADYIALMHKTELGGEWTPQPARRAGAFASRRSTPAATLRAHYKRRST